MCDVVGGCGEIGNSGDARLVEVFDRNYAY